MGRTHLICMFARKIVPLHLLILLYMKRLFLVFAVTLCVLTACNTDRDRLIEINGYLNDNRLDTAQICLNMVSPNDLSEYDRALYNLITVKLDHLSYIPYLPMRSSGRALMCLPASMIRSDWPRVYIIRPWLIMKTVVCRRRSPP